MNSGASSLNVISVALGLALLYLPIAILVVYSFNASRLVTIWGGWSLVWYRELLHDEAVLRAAWVSLRVAALSASAGTVLGTLAAVALTRLGRFRGRLLFSGMVYAPLVMPEVITGLSLLLLFVAFDVDRGVLDHRHCPHNADHVLCHGDRAVAACYLRSQPRGGRDGSRLPAGKDFPDHYVAPDCTSDCGRMDAGLLIVT